MAPTFRSSRSGRQLIDNNANRSRTVDHDVFEGLPVRRFTRQPYTVSQVEKMEEPESGIPGVGGSQTLPELPTPKDSHLLTPMSRALLRAARAGCIYIRHVNKDVEGDEKETTDADDTAIVPRTERSFTAKKWTVVPRHMEPPEVEYLAKRRPGLPSLYGGSALSNIGTEVAVSAPAPPMRKTRFKKVDPVTGNVSIYEAWVPEGQTLEGEIKETTEVVPEQREATVITEAPAPGTVVEGVGMVNAEGVVVAGADPSAVPKRRPPPPKRKAKGIGKGRKKKVMFAPGEGGDAAMVHGAGPDGVALENGTAQGELRMSLDGSTGEPLEGEDDEDEDGEGGESSDEDIESTTAAKSPSTATQEASATPATETNVVPTTEPSAEPQPSAVAPHSAVLPEQLSQQETQQTSEVPSDAPPADTQLTGTDSEQVVTDTPVLDQQPSGDVALDSPHTVAEPVPVSQPTPTSEPVQDDISKEQSLPASEAPQTTNPEPLPEKMESVEPTGPAEDIRISNEPEKADEEAETMNAAGDDTPAADTTVTEAPATTAETVTVVQTAAEASTSEPTVATFDDGEVDLLGTLEASLGDKSSTPKDQPAPASTSPKPEPVPSTAASSEPEPAEAIQTEPAVVPGGSSESPVGEAGHTEEKKEDQQG